MAHPIEYVTPPPPVVRRRSGLGLASLGLGLADVAGYVAYFWVQPQIDSEPALVALISAMFIVPGAGLTIGIEALRQPNRRRAAAIAGVTLNGMLLAHLLLSIGAAILF
jgi:hypothetical protein